MMENYEERLKKLETVLEGYERELRRFKDIEELQELHTNYAYSRMMLLPFYIDADGSKGKQN
jgi:hypothetical protein